MESKLKKILKGLDFWFVPSSFVRDAHKPNKDLKPEDKDTIIAKYVSAGGFELIRLTPYVVLTIKNIEKYF